MKGVMQVKSSVFRGCVVGIMVWVVWLPGEERVWADASAPDPQPDFQMEPLGEDLTQLSLEELMDMEVTSVSKKPQKLSQSAAAIYVITQEDIRRSGVTSIPEALRMVPGVQVAQQDANTWAVTARGFNSRFSNKLLVLVDGRSAYNPLFAGVFWEIQDTVLEDIERIEVIRGPGGTLWGTNAVNGVINIITKHSQETQGGLVSGVAGSEEGIGSVRYGGKTENGLSYRVFTKYFNRDTNFNQTGPHDDWRMLRGGFRGDWEVNAHNDLMFQGEIYDGNEGQRTRAPLLVPPFSTFNQEDISQTGGNALLRWKRQLYEGSDFSLQLFYDRFERKQSALDITLDTVDVDFQHRFPFLSKQEMIWGMGYRYWTDQLKGSLTATPMPLSKSFNLFSGFAQDEIQLIPNQLQFTLGTKVSHNDFTGWEYQPSGRLLWNPAPDHTVWAAVSRSVRVPSRLEDNSSLFVFNTTGLLNVVGNQRLKSEVLHAFELGYRLKASSVWSIDLATFYNQYDDLGSFQPLVAGAIPVVQFSNIQEAQTYGLELNNVVQFLDWWRVQVAYTVLAMDVDGPGLQSVPEGNAPRHQVSTRSLMDFPHAVQLDLWLRYMGQLRAPGAVPGYVELDIRLGWQPWPNMEVSVVGQNLLDKQHPEFVPSLLQTQATEVQRSVYGKVTWTFEGWVP